MKTKEYYREYRLRNTNALHEKLDKILDILTNPLREPTKPLEGIKRERAVKAPKDVKDSPQAKPVADSSALNVCVHCGKVGYRQGYHNGAMVWVCKEHL